MKRFALLSVLGLIFIVVAAGCATKSYVNKTVADERTRSDAAVAQVGQDVAQTKAELERLNSLTTQLEKKTDLAINQAKGFESYQVIWEGEIFFEYNSDKITVEAQSILDEAGDKMITNRSAIMEIAGFCDPSGSDKYNLELGNRRSAAAKYYLVDNFGVNLYRMFLVSYGERKAVETSDDTRSYAKERKVKIKIWDKPK